MLLLYCYYLLVVTSFTLGMIQIPRSEIRVQKNGRKSIRQSVILQCRQQNSVKITFTGRDVISDSERGEDGESYNWFYKDVYFRLCA